MDSAQKTSQRLLTSTKSSHAADDIAALGNLRNVDPSLFRGLQEWRYSNEVKEIAASSPSPNSWQLFSSVPLVSGQPKQSSGGSFAALCIFLGTAVVGGAYGYATWSTETKPSTAVVSPMPRVLPALAKVEARLVEQLGLYNDYIKTHDHALPEHLRVPVEVDLSSSLAIRRTLNEFRERFDALLQSTAISQEGKQSAYVWHPACFAGVSCWDCCEEKGVAFMLETFPRFHR